MILDYVSRCSKVREAISDNVVRISNSNKNFNSYLISSDYLKNNRMIFVVLPTLFDAQNYFDMLSNLLEGDTVLFYPVDDMAMASQFISSNEFKYERINTILTLLDNKPHIVVTTANGVLYKNLGKDVWENSVLKLKPGKEYDVKKIRETLVEMGFVCKNKVSSTGEFSFRGSIIDLYPLNYENPIRLDFFDDELETIKLFDAETQRTISKISEVNITPLVELIYSNEKAKEVIEVLKKEIPNANKEEIDLIYKDINKIELRTDVETIHNYIDLFSRGVSILDFSLDKMVYIINEDKINALFNKTFDDIYNHYETIGCKVLNKYLTFIEEDNFFSKYNTKYIDSLVDHPDTYQINTEEVANFHGNYDLLVKDLTKRWHKTYVILAISSPDKLKRIKEYFLEEMIQYQTIKDTSTLLYDCINIVSNEYVLTLSLPENNIYILSENVVFSGGMERTKIRYKSTFYEAKKISKYDELVPGDYVVHASHGIGIYDSIKMMELSGVKRDYIKINYAGTDSLYIPIEQLNLIKKYSGSDGRKPELTKLGSGSWAKAKQKVKEKVLELSKKIIELYALREEALGYQFSPDSTEQIEFESEFTYEETPDQIAAINAVKRDMESPRVMDRLICGDVGFGKTEIALRASFKAVMDGKQVCYLAPTTILSRQHYHTFKNRMEKYGVRVELLNRFVSAKQTNKVLKDLEFGTVDILIGAHRLLSDDVKFKDLGLLITDEEHRFGVMHKEKIKQMKINVDSLMLTATPIPRTLQMSLIGIKELSMIETPPKNRYPIQTYVTPRHDSVVSEAIERELLRGGQVFYLYNYTEDISDVMVKISKLVPEARVCYAHGKMDKYKLESIVSDFIEHKYDVLVSTTIIETGIDIPNANTLIIHDADRLGLSQLYQIRGRIGRSDRIAYAYLMYEPRKVLTAEAEKRLETIKEFTELGSGFKIAMRDLSIRGAGDLLGPEQSGFINSVGIDMYMQILEETLNDLRGVKSTKKTSTLGSKVISNRYVPENYEITEDIKIEIHNKISSIESFEDLHNLKGEFIDRFGPINDDLLLYMYEKLFYSLCKQTKVENIDIKPKLVTLTLSEEKSQSVDGEHVYKTAYSMSNNFLLSYHDRKINIALKTGITEKMTWLRMLCEYLEKIV